MVHFSIQEQRLYLHYKESIYYTISPTYYNGTTYIHQNIITVQVH